MAKKAKKKVESPPPAEKKAYKPRKNHEERLSSMANKKNKLRKAVWDFDRDGITYSLLSRFMVCPERFRLATVEGWSETGISAGLEFGSAFHHCLECLDKDPSAVVEKYTRERLAKGKFFGPQRDEFEVLMAMVVGMVHAYKVKWRGEDFDRTTVLKEAVWDIQYPLPMWNSITFNSNDDSVARGLSSPSFGGAEETRHVRLRGRFDEVFRSNSSGKLWLLETKTKTDIDHDGISRTLSQDLQTMLYVTAIQHQFQEEVEGVVYNVIRRPALKFTDKDGTLPNFQERIRTTALEQSDKYFYRWNHTFLEGEVARWQQQTLNPLLTQVALWWDSIRADPFDPWGSPLHYQRPFGCYDALASGRRGDFFELLTGGNVGKLRRRETAFPELEGDD